MNIVINQLVKNFSLTSFSIGFFKNYLSDWQIACIQAPGIQGLAVDSDWLSTQNAIGARGHEANSPLGRTQTQIRDIT